MTTKMKMAMAAMPAVITESIAVVLRAHGLTLSPGVLRELGRNTTQALCSLDELLMGDAKEPPAADRLAVGQTLRALAAAGRPNVETAPVLARVGEWLTDTARAELRAIPDAEARPGIEAA